MSSGSATGEPGGASRRLGLYTDLYEIRMLESYLRLGMLAPATFSLFVRPSRARPWLVAAGLDLALDVLDAFDFGDSELEYLESQGVSRRALEWLQTFEPSGELWAVDDGTIVLANEPILELTAPMPVAQLLETALMNAVHYDTLVATKAARLVLASGGRSIVDFGFRRAHGLESGVRAALASYIGGASATSNVEAGRRYAIPIAGTMAHSFVQAFDSELVSFREFAKDHPAGTTLLVDTYDTVRGVERAIEIIHELRPHGIRVSALRLDSEPLTELSKTARRLLDAAGLGEVALFASGGLDEPELAALAAAGAPFEGYGVGSALVCSNDKPALDIVYKLVEYEGRGRAKYSTQKQTLPGKKQVFRDGSPEHDVLELRDETVPGAPLLRPIWRDGKRLVELDVRAARERVTDAMGRLPESWRTIDGPERTPLPRIGRKLRTAAEDLERRMRHP